MNGLAYQRYMAWLTLVAWLLPGNIAATCVLSDMNGMDGNENSDTPRLKSQIHSPLDLNHMYNPSDRTSLLCINQLLLAPPFAALNSSIFATRFLNSSYWHFS
jgi:hypothetical protein